MTINKNSPIYFINFFTAVVFAFILALYAINTQMVKKIETAKNNEVRQLLAGHLPCDKPLITDIDDKSFYYCKNSNIISIKDASPVAYAGKIEYLASFNLNNLTIAKLDIIAHKETPGLGDKIEDKNWLSSIYNKSVELLQIKKAGGAIDSFTSASLTPKRFLIGLQKNLKWLTKNQQNIRTIINKD